MTSTLINQSHFTLHIRRGNTQKSCLELSQTRVKNGGGCVQKSVRRFFGFDSLNKHEEEALRFVSESKSDVSVNLPTGFGKSVVFQALPIVYSCVEPTCEKNIVLVVSPLINLMKDQVSGLISRGISAISLSDVSSELEIRAVENGSYSVVYGTPESLSGETKWRKMLSSDIHQNSVRAVAVDEAHVICHW